VYSLKVQSVLIDGSLSTWRVHVGAGGSVDTASGADDVPRGVAMLSKCQLCMMNFAEIELPYTRAASAIKKICRTVDTECILKGGLR
jgi:hypothetical protein